MGIGYFKKNFETEFEHRKGETYDPSVNRRTASTNVISSCSTYECCSESKIRPSEQACTLTRDLGTAVIGGENSYYKTSSKDWRTAYGSKLQQESGTEQDWNESRNLAVYELSESDNLNSVIYLRSENPQRKPRSSISRGSTFTESQSFMPYPITEVIPGKLYLGCEWNASNEAELLELGISHILSVSNRIHRIQGMEHEHFVMSDIGRTELETVLSEVYPFIKSSQQAEKKLFVHCTLGQNRSPTLVISFLIKNRGLTLYEAYKMLKEQRPLIQIHRNYAKMLLCLEKNILGKTSLPDDWMEQDGFCMIDGTPRYKNEELIPKEEQSFKTNLVEESAQSSTNSVSLKNVYSNPKCQS